LRPFPCCVKCILIRKQVKGLIYGKCRLNCVITGRFLRTDRSVLKELRIVALVM